MKVSDSKALDIEYGNWNTPSQAAKHIPGARSGKSVIRLCLNGEIEYVARYGEINPRTGEPTVRYYISDNAIRAYIRRNTKKAA